VPCSASGIDAFHTAPTGSQAHAIVSSETASFGGIHGHKIILMTEKRANAIVRPKPPVSWLIWHGSATMPDLLLPGNSNSAVSRRDTVADIDSGFERHVLIVHRYLQECGDAISLAVFQPTPFPFRSGKQC
jgi:hypothetical protein